VKSISTLNTLKFDEALCTGCGMCTIVCPQNVFEMLSNKAFVQNPDACTECGACQLNCPSSALSVENGVGCAAALMNAKSRGCCESSCECCSSMLGK
jgi:NAD-dependent dihydropyrimidine dehydrogenase PreA subunit